LPGLDTSLTRRSDYNHTIATFTAADNKTLWLRDLLKDDIPEARVFLYGYSASLFYKDDMNIMEEAENLLRDVNELRAGTIGTSRPIFLLGYSLGGILVKYALTRARLDDTFAGLFNDVYCTIFMGTPHRGANHVALADTVKTMASILTGQKKDSSWVTSLSAKEVFAESMRENYRQVLRFFQIVTIYETQEMNGKMVSETHLSLAPSAHFLQIVEKHSATLDQDGTREYKTGMHRNHVELPKFSYKDSDYKRFLSSVRPRVRESLRAVVVRDHQGAFATSLADPRFEGMDLETE